MEKEKNEKEASGNKEEHKKDWERKISIFLLLFDILFCVKFHVNEQELDQFR